MALIRAVFVVFIFAVFFGITMSGGDPQVTGNGCNGSTSVTERCANTSTGVTGNGAFAGTTPSGLPANGPDWPTGFVPYATNSIWNAPLPANTSTFAFASDSGAVVGQLWPNADFGNDFTFISEPGLFDASSQVYFCSSAMVTSGECVQVTYTNCNPTSWFGGPNCVGITNGQQIFVPKTMHINGSNNDNILAMIQPNGEEFDAYCFGVTGRTSSTCEPPGWTSGVQGSWSNGNSLSFDFNSDCGNFLTGSGFLNQPNPAGGAVHDNIGQGGQCGSAGLLHPKELASGTISHALYLLSNCDQGWVYPAYPSGRGNPGCTGTTPFVGERIWYDVPCDPNSPGHVGFSGNFTRTNASLDPWERAFLCAMNQYGGFIMDNGSDSGSNGTGLFVRMWGEVSALSNNSGDQGAQLAPLWNSSGVGGDFSPAFPRWHVGNHLNGSGNWAPTGLNFNGHMHVLCESVTQGGSGCH